MKKLKLIIKIFIVLTIISCSSDDDNTTNDNKNGFTFQNTFYPAQYAIITDENTIDDSPSDISINLSNLNPFNPNEESTTANYVFFNFEAVSINTGTFPILPNDYVIFKNGNLDTNGNITLSDGDTVLDNIEEEFTKIDGFVTINSFSKTQIDLNYTFTRKDGEIIKGQFSGTYLDFSN